MGRMPVGYIFYGNPDNRCPWATVRFFSDVARRLRRSRPGAGLMQNEIARRVRLAASV